MSTASNIKHVNKALNLLFTQVQSDIDTNEPIFVTLNETTFVATLTPFKGYGIEITGREKGPDLKPEAKISETEIVYTDTKGEEYHFFSQRTEDSSDDDSTTVGGKEEEKAEVKQEEIEDSEPAGATNYTTPTYASLPPSVPPVIASEPSPTVSISDIPRHQPISPNRPNRSRSNRQTAHRRHRSSYNRTNRNQNSSARSSPAHRQNQRPTPIRQPDFGSPRQHQSPEFFRHFSLYPRRRETTEFDYYGPSTPQRPRFFGPPGQSDSQRYFGGHL
jgi:hypothetical protein